MQAFTQEPEAPPTIKNAGRVGSDESGILSPASILMIMALFVLITGAMLQAAMTAQGRARSALALNAGHGVAVIALMAVAMLLAFGSFEFFTSRKWTELAAMVAVVACVWSALAIMGFAIGSIVKRPAKR